MADGCPKQDWRLLDEHDPPPDDETPSGSSAKPQAALAMSSDSPRRVVVQPASAIAMRPVRWLWTHWLPRGAFTLLAGREGIGKSTVAYWLAAQVTTGALDGDDHRQPRSVIISASEDSWAHTIVPRLVAAGADLTRVYRVAVDVLGLGEQQVNLPRDLAELAHTIRECDASLLLLDPLMSRLSASLSSNVDPEVRQSLEPLARLADETNTTVLGIIHVNKARDTDALNSIMGSRAFVAVARSVLFAIADMSDADDEGSDPARTFVMTHAKSNLGPRAESLRYEIHSRTVADTDDGPVYGSLINWTGADDRDADTINRHNLAPPEEPGAVDQAADWLVTYLAQRGGTAKYADITRDAKPSKHSPSALQRARIRERIVSSRERTARPATWWTLPDALGGDGGQGAIGQ